MTEMIPAEHILLLGAALFCIGLTVTVVRKNAIVVLMGIELMLNAANVNLVGMSRMNEGALDGQMMGLFIIVVAAAEAAVALAIVLKAIKQYNTSDVDEINKLKG